MDMGGDVGDGGDDGDSGDCSEEGEDDDCCCCCCCCCVGVGVVCLSRESPRGLGGNCGGGGDNWMVDVCLLEVFIDLDNN